MAKYRFNKYQKEWLKKLRSGRFKQGQGTLHRIETGGYCCLGVAARACGVRGDSAALNRNADLLDDGLESVANKLRLNNGEGEFSEPVIVNAGTGEVASSLVLLNDRFAWDFNEIADFIEQHPELVFNDASP